ncbi:hypothetical protein HWV62_21436 [Athelia sp. TMB]|nr:hypothetical protein HWV62_21436 [Athelia sp. TMB]
MSLSWLARYPFRALQKYNIRAKTLSNNASDEITRIKNPHRGGQNLTSRHRRLENMVRGKEAQTRRIEELPGRGTVVSQTPNTLNVETFRGLVVPKEPKPPESDGCAICVHDLYQESLDAYYESLASLRTSLGALGIPEAEWPISVRASKTSPPRTDVSGDAFAAMERALQAKREAQSSSNQIPAQQRVTTAYGWENVYEALRWIFLSNR